MSPAHFVVQGLNCGYAGRIVVRDVDFTLSRGEFLCLLGPNGVGKTTLFKTLLRLMPALGGRILVDGEDIAAWSRQRIATTVAYVPQAHTPPFPFEVALVVAMGRTAHLGPWSAPGREDAIVTESVMEALGIAHLARRACTEISGGERQLMLLARALVQQPRVIVLDEPTSALDFGNQVRILDHVAQLVHQSEMSVLMTTHDPNHALRYATHVASVGRDGSFSIGCPRDVVNAEYLRETYEVDANFVEASLTNGTTARLCLPLGHARSTRSTALLNPAIEAGNSS